MCMYNGEQYSSDTARLIRKFDIYVCDLGDFEDGLLGKERPCVVVKNDDEISPKTGCYLVAPIRTEHQMEVSKDTLSDVVDYRRQVGRSYVPIEMSAGDFRFIDISQIRTVYSTKVLRYYGSVINRKVRNEINIAMAMLQFSDEELAFVYKERFGKDNVEPDIYEEIKEPEYNNTKSEPAEEDKEFVIESDTEIGRKINAAINKQSNANEHKFRELYKQVQTKELSKSTASHKLGLTIKEFDKIAKEIKKEDKPPSKYSTRSLPKTLPHGFSLLYKAHKEGKMTIREMKEKLGKSEQTCYNYIARYEQLQNENKITT